MKDIRRSSDEHNHKRAHKNMNSPEEDVEKHMLKFQGKLPSYIKIILTKIVTHTDQIC